MSFILYSLSIHLNKSLNWIFTCMSNLWHVSREYNFSSDHHSHLNYVQYFTLTALWFSLMVSRTVEECHIASVEEEKKTSGGAICIDRRRFFWVNTICISAYGIVTLNSVTASTSYWIRGSHISLLVPACLFTCPTLVDCCFVCC